MPQPKVIVDAELDRPNPERFVEDSQGYLYDCAFREHIIRRVNPEQIGQVETLRAVALAGKRVNQAFEANLQRLGLSHAHYKLLMAVRYGERGGTQMHRIAAWLGVTPRNVTAIVDALEAAGLLARVADPNDRRAFIVRLTPAGEEKAAAAWKVNEADRRRVLSALEPEEMKQLRHLCMKLVRAAEAPQQPRR